MPTQWHWWPTRWPVARKFVSFIYVSVVFDESAGKVDEKATQLHAIASLKVLLDATKPQRGAATSTAASNVRMNFKETTLVAERPNGIIDTTLETVSLRGPLLPFQRQPHFGDDLFNPIFLCFSTLCRCPAAEQRLRRAIGATEHVMAERGPKTLDLHSSCTDISAIMADASRHPNTARQAILRHHIRRVDFVDSRILISYGLVGECVRRNGRHSARGECRQRFSCTVEEKRFARWALPWPVYIVANPNVNSIEWTFIGYCHVTFALGWP